MDTDMIKKKTNDMGKLHKQKNRDIAREQELEVNKVLHQCIEV